MNVSWDEAKRHATLKDRGLDFAWVAQIFGLKEYIIEDTRFDYGERRLVSVGYINSRLCVVIWTPRNDGRHVISMRKANDREQARYKIFVAP